MFEYLRHHLQNGQNLLFVRLLDLFGIYNSAFGRRHNG